MLLDQRVRGGDRQPIGREPPKSPGEHGTTGPLAESPGRGPDLCCTISPAPIRPGQSSVAAFFDAYLSNWIGGTEFGLGEARETVLRGAVPRSRPADGHDLLGTLALVSDGAFMTRALTRILPGQDGFIEVVREAHRRIMSGRLAERPGIFRTRPNRAGVTVFAAPAPVRGTLREAHGLLATLPDGLGTAAYLMCGSAEGHSSRHCEYTRKFRCH